jgi:ElaA protein
VFSNDVLPWKLKDFEDLSPGEIYDILALRSQIFVVEQNCVFQEIDGKDKNAFHLFVHTPEMEVVAACRLLASASQGPYCAIGRLVVAESCRNIGLGRKIFGKAIEECHRRWPEKTIFIEAQAYLEKFYSGFGFQRHTEVYMLDGIPHLQMLKSPG